MLNRHCVQSGGRAWFNGTAALQARGIRVITAGPVAALIPAVHTIRWGWFGQEFAPDSPKEPAQPDAFADQTTTLSLHGLTLKFQVLGRGASGAHVVLQHRGDVFVGDLVNPSNHAWLELGWVNDGLARLQEIKAMEPVTLHPGRGAAGGPALLEQQAA